MNGENDNDNMLSRWSKRKREADDTQKLNGEEKDLSIDEQQAELEERELELAANRQAAEEIDLDTIDEESDLSLFMKEGVPNSLKKAALAKLWRSSPVFANVDGLVDYDDNFADPNLIMKTFTSAYQVGRGYLKDVLEEIPEEVTPTEESTKETISDEELSEESTIADATLDAETELQHTTEDFEPASLVDEQKPSSLPRVSLRTRLGLPDNEDS